MLDRSVLVHCRKDRSFLSKTSSSGASLQTRSLRNKTNYLKRMQRRSGEVLLSALYLSRATVIYQKKRILYFSQIRFDMPNMDRDSNRHQLALQAVHGTRHALIGPQWNVSIPLPHEHQDRLICQMYNSQYDQNAAACHFNPFWNDCHSCIIFL